MATEVVLIDGDQHQIHEVEQYSSKSESTAGASPTSVICTEERVWALPVDVSFDESMNAETSISVGSELSNEESLQCSRDEMEDDFISSSRNNENESNRPRKNCAGSKSQTDFKNTSELDDKGENSFYNMMSQFMNYTQKRTDPLKRMKSDSRRRAQPSNDLRRHKSTGALPNKRTTVNSEKSSFKPENCESPHSEVPLNPQTSNATTSTNQSLSQSMTDLFDESIVWSISDICTATSQVEHEHDGATILYENKMALNESHEIDVLNNSLLQRPHIQNRIWTGNAQAKYSQDLRYGTTFDYVHDMDIIQTTKSFGDDLMEEEFMEKKDSEIPVTLMMDTFGLNTPCPSFCLSFGGDSKPKRKMNCRRRNSALFDSPMDEKNWSEDEEFYDSDPGEIRFRHRRPRRAFVQEGQGVGPSFLRTQSMRFRRSRFSHYNDMSRLDINFDDESLLEIFVEEMKNMTMNIIWHPSQCTDAGSMKIMRSRAWIEMGSLLSQTVIHPKFMWKSAYEPNLFRRKINVVPPCSIDLLDIIGIVPVQVVDRKEHPFARPWCSFKIITVKDRYFLFEAEDRATRDKIVFGLKLIVARLASKVLVAGEVAEDEFFTPAGRQVYDTWWMDETERQEEEEEL